MKKMQVPYLHITVRFAIFTSQTASLDIQPVFALLTHIPLKSLLHVKAVLNSCALKMVVAVMPGILRFHKHLVAQDNQVSHSDVFPWITNQVASYT